MSEAVVAPALRLEDVRRTYGSGPQALTVLEGANLSIRPGELVALVAPSGSGKSTLLHLAGLLEMPDAGELYIGERPCGGLSDDQRTRLRRLDIGFVYQFHHLLPELTALENVVLPLSIAGCTSAERDARARDLLGTLGLAERLTHRPAELSGGEQQRVAIARAVANGPRLLLADEPTGNLDPETSDLVFAELTKLVRETGTAALIATHNHELAGRMDRTVTIEGGRILERAVETT